jgi:lipid A disaccharide synthetase
MGEKLVTELIQSECNASNMAIALEEIKKPEVRERIATGYRFIRESLLTGGGAETAAKEIISDLLPSKSK